MHSSSSQEKIGIIAGGGGLPLSVARSAHEAGSPVHIIGIEGEADSSISEFPHSWMKWGEIGKLFQVLKAQEVKQIVIIGSVTRPDLSQVRMDFGAIKNLPFILSLMVGGDNSLLSGIVKFFEDKGFRVRGANEVAPDLVCPQGALGKLRPSKQDEADIQTALKVVTTLGPLDVGQGAVAARGHVIAVEAAEGTDAMLERCASLRQWGNSRWGGSTGVLVKCPKPTQEIRIDMPAVGPRTVELAVGAGLSGIALSTGNVLLAEKAKLIADADAAGLFVIGIDAISASETD